MKNLLGTIIINGESYFAELKSDFIAVFCLKIIDYDIHTNDPYKIEICSGDFEKIGCMTLLNGTIKHGTSGGLQIQVFTFEYLIKGAHFTKLNDIQANIVNFESEILKKIFKDSHINVHGYNDKVATKPLELAKSKVVKICIYDGERNHWKPFERQISHYKYLHFRNIGGAAPIGELCKKLDRMKNLFYLLGFADKEDSVDKYTFVFYKCKKKIHFELFGWNYKIKSQKFNYFKTFNITFHEVFSNNSILEWLVNEEYQKLFLLLFEKHFLKIHPRELSFLNSVFVMERFHRKFIDQNKSLGMDKRLRYFTTHFKMLLPDTFETSYYINKIERTRHNISHFEDKPDVFRDLELYYASLYIEVVLVISILERLGVSQEHIILLSKYTKQHINSMFMGNKNLEFSFPYNLK